VARVARPTHSLSDQAWEEIVAIVVRWRSLAEELAAVFERYGGDDEAHRSALAMTRMADDVLDLLGYSADRLGE
jgi:hypothetical protein